MNPTQTELFQGKVICRDLPSFCHPPDSVGLPLKRLLLAKGELAQFHNSDLPIRYIAWLELKTGIPRGNHYHDRKEEHVYVVSGSILLKIKDLQTGEHSALRLEAGALVRMAPGVAHVLEPLTDGSAIEFSPNPFDPADTHPASVGSS